jgi:hypothetical protein
VRHTAAASTPTARPRGPLVVAGLAVLAHLVVGWSYLASGLVMPGYALVPMWLCWLVLAGTPARLARRRSWRTPVAPVVAAGTWVPVLVGEYAFGWTP